MPLQILAGPGCDSVGKDEFLEDELEAEDVVISAGKLFKSLTGSVGIPSEKPAALRLALKLRSAAIRVAREKELSGWILTSNGSRAHLDRLVAESGAARVTVLKLTEAQACKRVGQLVTGAARDRRASKGSAIAGLPATNRKPAIARSTHDRPRPFHDPD